MAGALRAALWAKATRAAIALAILCAWTAAGQPAEPCNKAWNTIWVRAVAFGASVLCSTTHMRGAHRAGTWRGGWAQRCRAKQTSQRLNKMMVTGQPWRWRSTARAHARPEPPDALCAARGGAWPLASCNNEHWNSTTHHAPRTITMHPVQTMCVHVPPPWQHRLTTNTPTDRLRLWT